MTDEQIKEVEHLAKKSPALAELLNEWRTYSESPYMDTYLTLYHQIEDWNDQLKIKEVEQTDGVKVVMGRINLFSDKDSKEFDRTFKYFADITTLLSALESIRLKMKPSEQKDLHKQKKLTKNETVAV